MAKLTLWKGDCLGWAWPNWVSIKWDWALLKVSDSKREKDSMRGRFEQMFLFYLNYKTVFLIYQEYVLVQSVNLVWIWTPILKSLGSPNVSSAVRSVLNHILTYVMLLTRKWSAAHMLLVTLVSNHMIPPLSWRPFDVRSHIEFLCF